MNVQENYWVTFNTIKRDAIYINKYHQKVEGQDRYIKIFLAVMANGSIASWAIWHSLSPLWGALIAASQALNAIKGFLPFQARLSALAALGPELEGLAITAESDWLKVSEGVLRNEDIHKLAINLKRKVQQVTQRSFKSVSLPEDARLLELAEVDTKAYMDVFREEES